VAFSFACCVVTHIGNRRKNNEDNFYIGDLLRPEEQAAMSQAGNKRVAKNHTADTTANRIFAVSDGMGGHAFGEVASYIVASALREFAAGRNPSRRRADKFAYVRAFQNMVAQTNCKILDYAAANDAAENMGATLSGLIAFPDEVAPFNIGDSSTFLYEDSSLRKLTTDDNELSMFGDTDSSELKANGKRLTKYFGLPKSSGILTASISAPIPLKPGQMYIVTCDGLTDCLSGADIAQILQNHSGNLEETANALVECALRAENGGRDNITVAVIMITNFSK
jgi:protein phosphatase